LERGKVEGGENLFPSFFFFSLLHQAVEGKEMEREGKCGKAPFFLLFSLFLELFFLFFLFPSP